MRKISVILLAIGLSCIGILFVNCSDKPLKIDINSPLDGTITKTNLVRVSGIVSSPEASVRINGHEATVAFDGSFYAYLDLAKGKNKIEAVAITGKETARTSINATYSQALAVHLSSSDTGDLVQPGEDIFITALGHVIPVVAAVEVNGVPVEVAEDGSFSMQVQLYEGNNIVTAKATFEGEADTYSFTRIVEDGRIIPPPGQGMMYLSRFSYEQSIEMKAGGEIYMGVVGNIRKDIFDGIKLSCELYPVAGEYSETRVFPEGLEVSIEPSGFTVHPNTVYNLTMAIKTTQDTLPGEYYLYFPVHSNGRYMGGWIKLVIKS
jgi:hypothetical protein